MATVLREDTDSPPERLLQAVWQHQRVLRDRLRTTDGLPLKILHPGFINREGGPDFRSAVVQIGDETPRTGDIEVDLRSSGWRAHGHDRNPAFAKVMLHVIWDHERPSPGAPPLLVLRNLLDASIGELSLWLSADSAASFPQELRGHCYSELSRFSNDQLLDLLRQAAHVRLRSKAEQFHARARHAGWEQSLFEGLCRALGYKHNVWPMQRLAELRPRWLRGGEGALTPLQLQARLLGVSGLLPTELTRTQAATDNYLRQIWNVWWRERDEFLDCMLPKSVWHLHCLRPANHPQRRLALAAAWATDKALPAKIERWCAKQTAHHLLPATLLQCLQVQNDDFWSSHWTLRSAPLKKEQPLLGLTRITDLAINVVLPWLWIRAVEGKSRALQDQIEERYFNWPAAEDNSVLRLARNRLLGGGPAQLFRTAAAQQGLMQIVRDFCDHSNAICDTCKLPQVIKRDVLREVDPECAS